MDRRPELHEKFKALLGSDRVYFQPPRNVRLVYPCIIYDLNMVDIKYADNTMYLGKKGYTVTVISPDPDYPLWFELLKLPLCRFDRFYTADDLSHWVLEIYY